MKSVRTAVWFALTCCVAAFLLSAATNGGDLRRSVTAAWMGLVVGFLLMLALRSRP